MQYLVKQEQFEMELLDRLNSQRFLDNLLFIGGTMLRLCYGLNRFSVDLDFYFYKKVEIKGFFKKLKKFFEGNYEIKDAYNKFNTLLFELKTKNYPRRLKIEIRKKILKVRTESSIAYSKFSNIQVLVKTPTLSDVMKMKADALISRNEIRDAFDMEFLYKKGIGIDENQDFRKILKVIENFKKSDYAKLGSLLESKERKYYTRENFKILKSVLVEKLK